MNRREFLGKAGLALAGIGLYTAVERSPLRIGTKLTSNTDPSRYHVYFRKEEHAIEDMIALLHSTLYEEMYFQAPRYSLWVEIGIGEEFSISNTDFFSQVKENYGLKRTVMSLFDTLVHWHYHPDFRFEIEKLKENSHLSGQAKFVLEHYQENPIFEAIPSFSDIELMLNNTHQFHTQKKTGSISHKICSKYGVTTYDLTEEGIKRCLDFSPIEVNLITSHSHRKSGVSLLELTLENMSNDHLTITFQPHNPLPPDYHTPA